MKETLGERITRLRTENNMSQGDLADALDISRQSVSKWETNTSVPELDKLIRLAEIFGISMDALILGRSPESPAVPEPTPEPVQEQPAEEPVHRPSSRTPIPLRQSITGACLLGFSALASLICLILGNIGGFLTGVLLTAPLWLAGILCLCVRRRFALWYFWLLYAFASLIVPLLIGGMNLTSVFRAISLLLILSTVYSFRSVQSPSRMPLRLHIGVWCSWLAGTVVLYFAGKAGIQLLLDLYLSVIQTEQNNNGIATTFLFPREVFAVLINATASLLHIAVTVCTAILLVGFLMIVRLWRKQRS